MPDAAIAWRYFSHDERTCEANIKYRNRDSLEADLRELRKYSIVYSIPKGADVLYVIDGSAVHGAERAGES